MIDDVQNRINDFLINRGLVLHQLVAGFDTDTATMSKIESDNRHSRKEHIPIF